MAQQPRFSDAGFTGNEDDTPVALRGSASMRGELFYLALTSNKLRARSSRRDERHDAALPWPGESTLASPR